MNLKNFRHGGSYDPLYRVWQNMKQRCSNPNNPQFKDWGGRGIGVCDEWWSDYIAFEGWAVTSGYRKGLTLDRKDNDGPYTPANCRWVTRKQNLRNKRSNKFAIAFGEEKTLGEWAEDPRCKVRYHTLHRRIIRQGWSAEYAITSCPFTTSDTKAITAY